ncbi:BREX-1 system adenine-specific DNA-methyltransferase PglX [Atopococcus tabaci]|uniref:BREX-1 system adenine-specific DNA-methyltransferase PglX n=1 Tax=Atopococcus tabaci TaxID=269774 RepID=UPI000421DE3D|nr:BREX-1 system adenine-specific DNA-methyltransferase PglX [Atopococcus tabaci]
MDKTALKRFSVQARKKMMDAVKQKAYAFGITKDEVKSIQELPDGLVVNGTVMGEVEKKQYTHLRNRIVFEGYDHVMEEAAYTWFNRLIAFRYMEVNGFLPIQMRVLSSETPGKTEPDALTRILDISDELGMKRERIYELQDANRDNELYQYLLVMLSNKLGEIIPNVFEHITDDLALLLPDNLLNENSIVRDIVTMIDEEDWKNVEIVGWLYQFYISEEKDAVFSRLKKNTKIGKDDIGPATQLFTPRWIVQYMVDNSLGRLWLESHPNEEIKEKLEYYLDDAEQTEDVKRQLEELKDPSLDVEQIKFFDPSCGSGHILVYAFEVFYEMYLSQGYRQREIPKLILENNLYGLDIDKRAAQLATFAVIMKAREYDRRLFSRDFNVHVHSIEESNSITTDDIELFAKGNKEVQTETGKLVATFEDAKLYGSIIQVPSIDIEMIRNQMEFLRKEADLDIFTTELIEYTFPLLEDLISQYELMAMQYEVVVTNPPYMGSRGMDPKLSAYVKKHYKDEKSDLFAVFMEVTKNFTRENYYTATINQHSWMFLSSYEKLREKLLETDTIINMIHLGTRTFEEIGGEVVQNTTFIVRKLHLPNFETKYIRMTDIPNATEKQESFRDKSLLYKIKQFNFEKIPGSPIAYWASKETVAIFEKEEQISTSFDFRLGMATADNNRFLRLWPEVSYGRIGFSYSNMEDAKKSSSKWFPYQKGGSYRKWYGNLDYLVNWENNGTKIRNFADKKGKVRSHNYNLDYIFKPGITWSALSSGKLSPRFSPKGFLFDNAGSTAFAKDNQLSTIFYGLAFLSSKVTEILLPFINPTMNYQPGTLGSLPFITEKDKTKQVIKLTEKAIQISRKDWDSFETSWDFEEHPFLTYKEDSSLIQDSFNHWKQVAEERFYQLKSNEEELNRIFIDIYGLQDELTPDVEEKDVTVRKADLVRDVKSFLSYLVGVMFGRYSLDQKGLAYAGGEWDSSLYQSYQPDESNILPLTEEAYFEDDIVKKVEELVALIYGKETLEENLVFIADALKMKKNESPRDRIRRYFMKEFYKDHLQTYQKRPIYWQFTSGRRGAFKGLIYLHRYDRDTLGRLRTEYVLKESAALDNLIALEQNTLEDPAISKSEKAAAQKRIENYQKDKDELAKYDAVLDHMAKRRMELDLDDGVKVNYAKFQNIEVVDEHTGKVSKRNLLEKI